MEWLPTLLTLAGTSSSLWFLSQYNFWRPVRSFNYPRFLMYHHVGTAKDSGGNPSLRVSDEQFARHLQYLSERNYVSKSVSELVKEKDNLPQRSRYFHVVRLLGLLEEELDEGPDEARKVSHEKGEAGSGIILSD